MDLSKAFDTLDHDLLIAKLHAYGFDKTSLRLLKSYLSDRWQRTKINTSYSSWSGLLVGVPQGSVLGPLLFNLFINDLAFVIKTCVCNHADNNTPYTVDMCLGDPMAKLECAVNSAIEWFRYNGMILNSIVAAVAQWLRASNIFLQLCQSTSKWRWFEFAKTQLSILNH